MKIVKRTHQRVPDIEYGRISIGGEEGFSIKERSADYLRRRDRPKEGN